jgi:AsmA protein
MKKAIKWTSIVLGVLVVLVIAALLIVPMFVDINTYKPEIEKKVSEAIGRPFTIGGDIKLSLFPWAGVAMSDLRLGNPPGFREKNFVLVKSFDVQVKLLPLISKDIQVKRFVLDGPRVVLEKDKHGRGNWEDLGRPSKKAPPKHPKEETKASKGGISTALPIKSLAVGEFAIKNGLVLFIDHAKGIRRELSDFNLRLQDVSLDRPIRLALLAQLDKKPLSLEGSIGPVGKDPGKGTIPLSLSVKALNELDIGLKGKIVDLATRQQFDLALEVSPFSPRKVMAALGQAFPVVTADSKALSDLALKAKVKGDSKQVTLSNGFLNLDGSKMTFSMKAKAFNLPDVTFNFDLDKIDLDRYLPPPEKKKIAGERVKAKTPGAGKKKPDYTPLRRLIVDGTIRVGELKAQGVAARDVYVKVTGRNGRFQFNPLSLKLHEGGVSVRGSIDVGREDPRFDIALQVQPFSPRRLFADMGKAFPVKTADPKALTRVGFKAKLKGDLKNSMVLDGTMDVDKSRLSYFVKAKDFNTPDVTFKLDVDDLDLDRYLPPSGEKKVAEEKGKPPETGQKRPDYSTLRKMTLDGTMQAAKLKFNNARMQNLKLKVIGEKGVFHLSPVYLSMYRGVVSAKGTFDVRQDTPKSNLKLHAEKVQIGPLLRDVLKKDVLEGTARADMVLRMSGDDPVRIKQTLNGSGELLFQDGAIKGFDLAGMVRNIKATFGLAARGGARPKTDFSELKAPFTITNGIVNTRQTSLMSPLLRVVASGNADLVKETLDIRIEPKVVASLKGQGDAKIRSGLIVPILVTGTFSSPKFRPDLKGAVEQTIKKGLAAPSRLKEIITGGDEEGSPSKVLEEKVKGLLKELPFGR